jgi:NAD(P)-dependent dehydrogenase (short-subunit alcohol dehydrogenase family)
MGNDIFHLEDADWLESFAINVSPAMVLARALAPMMAASGGGSIVNVGSPAAIVGARKPSYAASKAALSGLTLSLARNLGPKGIRVNLFLPGPMITPMTEDWPEEKRAAIAASSFLGRLCQPEESAAVIAFLLSPAASYITGAVIDGTAGSMFGH